MNWQRDKNEAGVNVEDCNSDKTSIDQKVTDGSRVLKSVCCTYLNKLVFAHLNINSIRNKFELLSEQVRANIDVLIVSEIKIGESFSIGNFLIYGFVHHIGFIVIQKMVEYTPSIGKILLQIL